MNTWGFLGLFALFGYVNASPISAPSDSNGQTASVIYVVLAVLVVVALLAILKYFYMKNRRVQSARLFSKTSSSYYDPFSIDSYCPSSASLHAGKEVSEKESVNDNSGFFVGLLGSPAWETKITLEADAAACRQHQNSSFTYQLGTQSRQRSSQPYQPQWKLPSISPQKPFGAGDGAMRLSKSSSLNLPKRPEKPHDPRPRRLSLPSRSWKRSTPSEPSIGDRFGKRSRGSSQSGRKRSLRALKTERTSISDDSSPRLMKGTDDINIRPRSPVFSPSSSPLFLSNPFPPKFKLKTARKPVSPLPSLPVRDPFSSAANASSTSIPLSTPSGISPPSSLLPKTNDTILKSSLHDSVKGRSRDSCLYQELLPVLKPLDVYNSVPKTNQHTSFKHSDIMPVTRQALGPITCPTNCASGLCVLPLLQTSPPLSVVPIFAQKAVLSKPRTKQKSTSDAQARGRRSSSIGPSPLRAMILPDSSSGSDVGSPHRDINDKENNTILTPDQNSRLNTTSNSSVVRSSRLGEFGELYLSLPAVDEEFTSQSDLEAMRASMNAEKASKLLLSMAREHENAERSSTQSKSTNKSFASRSRSWEPSKEVDLGLLGLDRFIGDGCTLDGSAGDKDDSEIDFVSFWAEARLLEEEERRRESIGLAS